MKQLLTPLAIGLNLAGLAGLYLAIGETPSDLTAPTCAGIFTLSTLALLAKAGR